MLGWYTKAEQLIHGPHMVSQPSGHGGGHWLPLLPRPFLAFGWEGVGQTLPSTAVGDHKVIVGKCQGELMLEVVRLFGEGVHLPSQPARMLAHRQIVALHAIGVHGPTDRRRLERRFSLG